jgi:hypothetical protein
MRVLYLLAELVHLGPHPAGLRLQGVCRLLRCPLDCLLGGLHAAFQLVHAIPHLIAEPVYALTS